MQHLILYFLHRISERAVEPRAWRHFPGRIEILIE
jgi:hypothetical protein